MTTTVGREWKVRIDVELSPEAHDRITRAIQRAALTEIAELDVADGFSISLRGPGERGATPVREGEDDPFRHRLPGGGFGQTDGIVARDPAEVLGPDL
jgi:hypothetical protein